MRDTSKYLKVGLVSIGLMGMLLGLIFWQSNISLRQQGYQILGVFEEIAGLNKGAEVRYRGFAIGRVIEVTPEPTEIIVVCYIQNSIKIPINSKAKILFDGLVGENYISIEPNILEKKLLKDGDYIDGSSGSDLSRFIDLGSQNLVHTEAILEALRKVFTSDDVSSGLKSVLINFDVISQRLATLLGQLDVITSNEVLPEMMGNFYQVSKDLSAISHAIAKDGAGTEQIAQMTVNLSEFSEDIRIISDRMDQLSSEENMAQLDEVIGNMANFSDRLNALLSVDETEYGEKRNVFQRISSLDMQPLTAVTYDSEDKKAYYEAGLSLDFGEQFIQASVTDRNMDPNSDRYLYHIQHGVRFNPYLTTRLGLFYKNPGVGFDWRYKKWGQFSLDIYNITDLELDFRHHFSLFGPMDVLLGVRQKPNSDQINHYLMGAKYQF